VSLNIHAVVFIRGAEKGISLLQNRYGKNVYQMKDGVMLVASNDLSSQISDYSSISGDNDDEAVRGAVFKLNGSYAGYAPGSLWEWLETIENATSGRLSERS